MSKFNRIAFRIPLMILGATLVFVTAVGMIVPARIDTAYREAEKAGCLAAAERLEPLLLERAHSGDCAEVIKTLEAAVEGTPVSGAAFTISSLKMQCSHHAGLPVTDARTTQTVALHEAGGVKVGELTLAYSLDAAAAAAQATFYRRYGVAVALYLLLLLLIFRSLRKSLQPLEEIGAAMARFNPAKPSETRFPDRGTGEVASVVRGALNMFDALLEHIRRLHSQSSDTTDGESHLKEAQRMANIGSWEYQVDTGHFGMSTEMYRILALNTKSNSIGWEPFLAFVADDDREFVRQVIDDAVQKGSKFHMGYKLQRVNGEVIEVHTYGKVRKKADGKVRITGVTRDVTEQNRTQRMIEDLAYFDPLTNLPNRVLFRDRLHKAIETAKRNRGKIAVLFLDLDHFKLINDTMGHHVGDKLLRFVADALSKQLRASDTISRIGGDEFVVVLSEIKEERDATLVAEKLLEALSGQHMVENHAMFVSTSIGIALYPEHAEEAAELVKCADTAMYEAKQHGRDNWQLYRAEMGGQRYGQLLLETELYEAVKGKKAFSLYYQPIFQLDSGKAVAMEALLRWHHGEEIVESELFVPMLESSGLIVELGYWVIANVAEQIASWAARGMTPRPVSVNLSARQLQDETLPNYVEEVIATHGIDPNDLGFEVSEGVMISNVEFYTSQLQRLKKLGVRLCLDDYGRGLSSIEHLARFPIDTIKTDQFFVQELREEENSDKIRAVTAMARALGFKTVVAGVEEALQEAGIHDIAAEMVQGYYYSRPLAAEAVEQYLK